MPAPLSPGVVHGWAAFQAAKIQVDPTSYALGVVADIADVPVRRLLAAGVPLALGTDDPLLFSTGLAGQYTRARDVLDCPDRELAALAQHSIAASAAPPDLRPGSPPALPDEALAEIEHRLR